MSSGQYQQQAHPVPERRRLLTPVGQSKRLFFRSLVLRQFIVVSRIPDASPTSEVGESPFVWSLWTEPDGGELVPPDEEPTRLVEVGVGPSTGSALRALVLSPLAGQTLELQAVALQTPFLRAFAPSAVVAMIKMVHFSERLTTVAALPKMATP